MGKRKLSGNGPTAKRFRAAARVVRRRRTNFAVTKIYRRTRKGTLKKKNKRAVMTLGRQVRRLQMRLAGNVQREKQHVQIGPGNMPTVDHPIFFCINDFLNGAPVYRGTVATVQGVNNVGQATVANSWLHRSVGDVQNLAEMHRWEFRNSHDQVSRVKYMPLSSHFTIDIDLANFWTNAPIKFRITVFTQKTARSQDFRSIVDRLPTYGGAFKNLAHDELKQRRNFSPALHNVLVDKWITIHPRSDMYRSVEPHADDIDHTNAQVQHRVQRRITIPWKFDGKMLYPDLKHPTTPGAHPGDHFQNEDFYTNIPRGKQIWCMISTNVTPGASGHPGQWSSIGGSMELFRSNKWRDPSGVATV